MKQTQEDKLAPLLKSPSGFRKWLREQDADTIVGKAGQNLACPIARYLKAHGISRASVGQSEVRTYLDVRDYYTTPDWAAVFIEMVDEHTAREPITARRAKRMLKDAVSRLRQILHNTHSCGGGQMKGTDMQKRPAATLGVTDWSPAELAAAARGFTLDEYERDRHERMVLNGGQLDHAEAALDELHA